MKTILVCSAGGVIGSSICTILKKIDNDIVVLGADMHCHTGISQYADKQVLLPSCSSPNYIDKLRCVVVEHDVSALVECNETGIDTLMPYMKEPFLDIPVLGVFNNIYEMLSDKLSCYNKMSSLGIPHVETYEMVPGSAQLQEFILKYKTVVIKRRRGSGSKSVFIIRDINELPPFVYGQSKHYVIQPYIGSANQEFTVSLSTICKPYEDIQFKRILQNGTTVFAETVKLDELSNISFQLSKLCNSPYVLNYQVRQTDSREFFIFEINPRFSSTVLARDILGFQDFRQWYNYVLYNVTSSAGSWSPGNFVSKIDGYKYLKPNFISLILDYA